MAYQNYGYYQQPSYQNYQNAGTYGQSQNYNQQQNRPIQPAPQVIPGKYINGERDILAMDVPTDGSIAFFVQNDLQKIFAKTWGGDGNIHQNVYVRVDNNNDNQSSDNPIFSTILERLDNIEKCLKKKNNYHKPYNKPQDRREENEQ